MRGGVPTVLDDEPSLTRPYYSNSKIDEHSQADIQYLIYLEHADVLVSEEKAFMRQAFMDLYQESGKQYWTLDELESAARA